MLKSNKIFLILNLILIQGMYASESEDEELQEIFTPEIQIEKALQISVKNLKFLKNELKELELRENTEYKKYEKQVIQRKIININKKINIELAKIHWLNQERKRL